MTLSDEQDCVAPPSGPEIEGTGRMPDFLIIGAMKSGTTSLFELLGRHPDIFVPYWKELQYFSRDHKFNRGEKFYRDEFIDAREDQLIGEASTCYSRWPHYPHAAERIAKRLPNIRLIYLMRHPVERAYSHYGHIMQERMIRKSGEILSFKEALENDREIIDASLYMMQIERYLPLFQRDQFLFLTLDELKSSPATLLQRTQEFLAIKPIDLAARSEVTANKWGDKVTETRIRGFIKGLQNVRGLSGVIKKVLPRATRQQLKDTLIQSNFLNSLFKTGRTDEKNRLSPLSPETREMLLAEFKEPTKQLEEFLGCELPGWHK